MSGIAQTYPQLVTQLSGQAWAPADFELVRRSHDLAAALFAGRVRGSGKPFIDHLVGTASGVVLDGAGAETAAAALLHAAYDQGDFGDRRAGMTSRHRATVRAAVGDAVEQIVAEYQQMGWGAEVAERLLARVDALEPPARAALRVRLANEVDDALDGGLVLSGKDAHPDAVRVPTVVVLELASRTCGPVFVATARAVLDAPPPTVPSPLVIGAVGSSVRMPLSARPRRAGRDAVRHKAGRIANRLAPGVCRRLRQAVRRVNRWRRSGPA